MLGRYVVVGYIGTYLPWYLGMYIKVGYLMQRMEVVFVYGCT